MYIPRTLVAIIMLSSVPVFGHDRNSRDTRSQGVPAGHLPPAGECRVWYDGRPPGQQPPPTDCRSAERVASREWDARVIYGGRRDTGQRSRERDEADVGVWRDGGGARRLPWPPGAREGNGYPNGPSGSRDQSDPAFANGYRDGLVQGQRDAQDNDRYNPTGSSNYRNGTSGYDGRLGSRDEYRSRYRAGFEDGYEQGFGREDRGESGQRRRHP